MTKKDFNQIESDILNKIKGINDRNSYDKIKTEIFGKKGIITEFFFKKLSNNSFFSKNFSFNFIVGVTITYAFYFI